MLPGDRWAHIGRVCDAGAHSGARRCEKKSLAPLQQNRLICYITYMYLNIIDTSITQTTIKHAKPLCLHIVIDKSHENYSFTMLYGDIFGYNSFKTNL